MGQCLHTKVAQVAAYLLNIPLESCLYIRHKYGQDIGFLLVKGIPSVTSLLVLFFAEVDIDTLTGDFHTRVADIIMDLGFSINPAIDIGQIEGAFVQGLGWVALEELKWGDAAHKWLPPEILYTSGSGTYKIPSLNDVPCKFSVSLLKDAPNVKAIHSSKAVGEPPFFLASSIYFAIKGAITAASAEGDKSGFLSTIRLHLNGFACLHR